MYIAQVKLDVCFLQTIRQRTFAAKIVTRYATLFWLGSLQLLLKCIGNEFGSLEFGNSWGSECRLADIKKAICQTHFVQLVSNYKQLCMSQLASLFPCAPGSS